MSVAVYPVLETEIPGLEPYLMVSGKGIGSNLETLEAVAKSLDVPTLMQFFSTNADEVADMMGLDEGETPDFPVIEEWFSPADALVTVQHLRSFINANPESVENTEWVLEDMDDITTVLTTAQEHGIRFHFAMDI